MCPGSVLTSTKVRSQREGKSLPFPPCCSLSVFLTWKHYGNHKFGSAYLHEAIGLLYMRRQQLYLLWNSNWCSFGACLPLLWSASAPAVQRERWEGKGWRAAGQCLYL